MDINTHNILLSHSVTELGGKDVEDLFTAVLSPSTSQPPPPPQVPHHQGPGPLPGTSMPHPNTGTSLLIPLQSNLFFVFENECV